MKLIECTQADFYDELLWDITKKNLRYILNKILRIYLLL
jgi:hypothetical protein